MHPTCYGGSIQFPSTAARIQSKDATRMKETCSEADPELPTGAGKLWPSQDGLGPLYVYNSDTVEVQTAANPTLYSHLRAWEYQASQ